MDPIPLLLDTDIGTDIDDALALAYLLSQPRCELLGITTVTGEAHKRAMLADALCHAAGHANIPIHVGAEKPLLAPLQQPHAAQAHALTDQWPHRAFAPAPTAVDFLRAAIRARPGEITLLTIGPLTNIALLFALDPELPGLLKQLVMMGGWYFDRPQPEWNMRNDPHAAAMVFAAPVPRLAAVGMDVTRRCRLSAEECRRRFGQVGGPWALVAAMAEVWFRDRADITFHDPLAAALVFEPGLCRLEPHPVQVVTGPEWPGLTVTVPGAAAGPVALAADVDRDAFFHHYFSLAGGER